MELTDIYFPEHVLDIVQKSLQQGLTEADFDGDLIKVTSDRYQTFIHKGLSCKSCGITGLFMAKEKHLNSNRYHFNLYAVDENDDEVLMTKDHIIPKSKGGKNHISNYNTMCAKCNEKKGNKWWGVNE